MPVFILEIGTEELPAEFAKGVVSQFEKIVRDDLAASRLKFKELTCSTTPRRISLLVDDLKSSADDSEEYIKGPPFLNAFKDGLPTQAAIGFSKRCGLLPDQLEVKETEKGDFVFARIIQKGRFANDLLEQLIPEWISKIQGRRFMRWGNSNARFARPIRWIVALLDSDVIPVLVSDCDPKITSSNISRGHRLYKNELIINRADEYISSLAKSGVFIERQTRSLLIRKSVNEAADNLQANASMPNSLLDELTDLVESPSLIICDFESSYLNLPPEVLCTVMRVHQRYIPLFNKSSVEDPLSLDSIDILLPKFLCISNGLSNSADLIKHGNERVLKARFADAEFFVKADLGVTSQSRVEKLNTVSFAEGLGSLYDRVQRIKRIVNDLIKYLNIDKLEVDDILRAAHFCKHDLVSNIVNEFPEIQGIMGAKYLLEEGESRVVAQAIHEHYLPKNTGDNLPHSKAGAIVALGERFELLISIFAKGERPSGSSDPYALKRSGNGIVQIIWGKKWKINIIQLIETSISYWSESLPELSIDKPKLRLDLLEFFRQRVFSMLEELSFDIDIIHSLAGKDIDFNNFLVDINDVKIKAELLSEMRTEDKLSSVQSFVTRASKLAVNSALNTNILNSSENININLFEKKSESNLLKVIKKLELIVEEDSKNKYTLLVDQLIKGTNILTDFFDGEDSVMVMCENSQIRNNRLNLLALLRNYSSIICDFTRLSN